MNSHTCQNLSRNKFNSSQRPECSEVNKFVGSKARAELSHANLSESILIYIYIPLKVPVLLPGNSANKVGMTSDKRKVARQQQVGRQAGVRCNSCLFIEG